MSISRVLRTLLIPATVAAVSLPVADAAYRAAGARPSDNLTGLYEAFGDGGFRHRADVATSADWYSGPFRVLTDGNGLRCGASDSTRTARGADIDYLVLGDSQGYGQCLDFEASIVGGVAAHARRAGGHVANASVGGHYLRNQLEIARWLVAERDMTVRNVVVLLTPYLVSASGGYNRVKVSADGQLFGGEPGPIQLAAVWAKTNTTIFGRVRNAVRNVMGAEADVSDLLAFFDDGPRREKVAAALALAMADVRAWAESIGAGVYVVYTPLAVELDFAPIAALAPDRGRSVSVEVPLVHARDVVRKLDLPMLDLTGTLAGIVADGNDLTCRGDPHYNGETSLACAHTIWNWLETGAPRTAALPKE